jgi:hypothetical protein
LLPKIFRFVLFCFFVSFSLYFIFVSLQILNQAKKHFFCIKAKKFCPRFASFRFEAKMMAVFRFQFSAFHFEAKIMAVFCFRFASFRFKVKMMAVFLFFFVLFSLRSIFVLLQIFIFRIDAKRRNGAPYSQQELPSWT